VTQFICRRFLSSQNWLAYTHTHTHTQNKFEFSNVFNQKI